VPPDSPAWNLQPENVFHNGGLRDERLPCLEGLNFRIVKSFKELGVSERSVTAAKPSVAATGNIFVADRDQRVIN
jgi:hypothetical protein